MSTPTQQPDSLAASMVEQMFALWINPHIEARQLDVGRIYQALVVLPPGGEPEVLLNDSATLTATCTATRDIARGEQVTAEDIEAISDLRPFDIDPAAGWAAFVVIPGHGLIVSFDARYDKPRAHEHLALADDYLATAVEALSAGRPGPAIEAGFTAAELAVKAMHLLQVFPVNKRTPHKGRLTWLNWYTVRDGNGSADWFFAVQRLEGLRPAAR